MVLGCTPVGSEVSVDLSDRTGVRNGLKSLRIDTCRFTMYVIGLLERL